MPDLSEIRKKAVKTSYQRVATGTNQTLSESFALEQITQWEEQAVDLASRAQTASNREQMLSAHQALLQKLEATRELAALLGFASDTRRLASFTVDVEKLSPSQKQRFSELKTILGLTGIPATPVPLIVRPARVERQPALPTNLQTVPTTQLPAPATFSRQAASPQVATEPIELTSPVKPAKIPDRFYRPGRIPLLGDTSEEENEDKTETASESTESQ